MKRSRHKAVKRPRPSWLLFLAACALAALGFAGWRVSVEARAARDLREGRAALERDDLATARARLAACLETRPESAEAHFLAARAARRAGDLSDAQRSLRAAEKYGWIPEAIDLERALIAARSGNLANVEKYLVACVEKDHPDTVQILEVLAPLYIQDFRLTEAQVYLQEWVKRKPDAVQAWTWLGDVDERLQRTKDAAVAYAEAAQRAPDDADARLRLARVLVELRRGSEALPHFEKLFREKPDDAGVRLGLARCRIELGDLDAARCLLDDLLADQPQDADALTERGRLELEAGHAAEAEPWLRRAVGLRPYESSFLYTLLRCLKQRGKDAEASGVQERLDRCEADLKRLREVTRAVASSPHDADLRYEAGVLFLQNSQEREGVRWLESALRENPRHAATHQKLAEYYERTGQKERAEQHRALAKPPPERR
jgi:predicted Zn-dependent protease